MEVICYRGGGGEYPENTMEGIANCIKVNPDWWVEIDLRITSDGAVVALHDKNLKRIANLDRDLSSLSYKQLKSIDVGWHFYNSKHEKKICYAPLLSEVLEEYSTTQFLLDIHDESVVDEVVTLVKRYKGNRSIIIVSEYDHILDQVKSKMPSQRCNAGTNQIKRLWISSLLGLDRFFPLRADLLIIPEHYKGQKVLTKRMIEHAAARNKPIWIYTVGAEAILQARYNSLPLECLIHTKERFEYYENLGVEGVFTDRPTELIQNLYPSQ